MSPPKNLLPKPQPPPKAASRPTPIVQDFKHTPAVSCHVPRLNTAFKSVSASQTTKQSVSGRVKLCNNNKTKQSDQPTTSTSKSNKHKQQPTTPTSGPAKFTRGPTL